MELVYLWVEKYKNIENQGFNFSPSFDCKYNKDSNELTIDEKKDYISIFPDNINITAIVGENGSGKSSLLEVISNKFEYYNTKPYPDEENFVRFFSIYLCKNKLLIANDNHKLNIKIRKDQIRCDSKIEYEILTEYEKYFNNLVSVFYSNTLHDLNLDLKNREFGSNTPHSKNISISSLLNNISVIKNNEINFGDYSKTAFSTIYRGFIANQKVTNITAIKDGIKLLFSVPERIKIENINFYEYLLKQKNEDEYKENNEKLSKYYSKFFIGEQDFKKKLEINIITALLISIKNNIMKQSYFNDLNFDNIFLTFEEDGFIKALSKIESSNYNIQIPSNLIIIFQSLLSLITDNKIDINIHSIEFDFESYQKLIFIMEPFLDFKWANNRVLSSGEETLLSQFSNFKYYIEKYDIKNTPIFIGNNKNLLILIDEGELTLHPNWQRKYIQSYIDFFKKNKLAESVHIIIASHSPFILSDLPKENIIFLEKGIQKEVLKENEQTFGSNIHTLLSHGFFMENGLMGEFSKSKIEEIKKFYELVKRFEEKDFSSPNSKSNLKHIFLEQKTKFRHIQSIIGEPFLQTVIKNYLDELEVIFNGKKLFLQDEIKRLQELESSL